MNSAWLIALLLLQAVPLPTAPTATELAGAWLGRVSHDGESTSFALELEAGDDGKLLIKMSAPVVQMRHVALGRAPLQVEGDLVRLGPFAFNYDRDAQSLTGMIPEELAPIYKLPVELHRVARLELPDRPEPTAPLVAPAWTFEAGAPLWPGTSFAAGLVLAGAEDGRLHALDPVSGQQRWSFRAGGPVRTRPVVDGDGLYFQADDGILYALAALSGAPLWQVRVVEKPVVRLPPDDPNSRFDRFGSDVAVAAGRLFVGTHDGRVLCLEPAGGKTLWEFQSGDSVLAAPAVDGGQLYFGSFDGKVYALDAATGRLLWKRDTGKPVVSTPALTTDRVIVGSRSYDFLGLERATGALAWKRYIWSSWVESSATVRDGVVYVGSSDAAALYAFEAHSGRPIWSTDVWGWAWGQPAVSATRVYMDTSGMGEYPVPHRAGVMAVERSTGKPVWRFEVQPPDSKAYGFTGSPALGAGRVFIAGLDGRVYAFPE